MTSVLEQALCDGSGEGHCGLVNAIRKKNVYQHDIRPLEGIKKERGGKFWGKKR